jgi:hypothetical protein
VLRALTFIAEKFQLKQRFDTREFHRETVAVNSFFATEDSKPVVSILPLSQPEGEELVISLASFLQAVRRSSPGNDIYSILIDPLNPVGNNSSPV